MGSARHREGAHPSLRRGLQVPARAAIRDVGWSCPRRRRDGVKEDGGGVPGRGHVRGSCSPRLERKLRGVGARGDSGMQGRDRVGMCPGSFSEKRMKGGWQVSGRRGNKVTIQPGPLRKTGKRWCICLIRSSALPTSCSHGLLPRMAKRSSKGAPSQTASEAYLWRHEGVTFVTVSRQPACSGASKNTRELGTGFQVGAHLRG